MGRVCSVKKNEKNCVERHCVKLFRVVYFVFRVVIQGSRVQIQVDLAFHPSQVDKMSTRSFWELSGKK